MVGSIHFVPPSLGCRTAAVPVTRIFIGALAPRLATASGRAKNPTSCVALTNHWVLHLVQDDKTSIRCDPSPSDTGAAPIVITFSEYEHGIPSDLVTTYDLVVRPDFTLDEMIEVIERGRFRPYLFDESGHGCRYWIWTLLSFLKENGIVTPPHTETGSLNGARIRLQQVWIKGGLLAEDEQQTHLVPGVFTDDE